MPDIRFECPSCKQHFTAPEELATQLVDCPGCGQVIEVPNRSQSARSDGSAAERVSPNLPASRSPSHMPPGTVAFVVVFCLYLLVLVLLFRQWREDQITRALSGFNLGGGEEADLGPTMLWLIFWGFAGGAVGFLAGRARGKQRLGAAWGLVLGPVGWLITLCSADLRLRCLECRGVIPDGARRCMHCGVVQRADHHSDHQRLSEDQRS